jgi:hypothetical protein
MTFYRKPSVLSLTSQDLFEFYGPAETQYCMVVSTNPTMGANLYPGDNILIKTDCTIDTATVSPADILVQGSLPDLTAVAGTARMGPTWDVTVLGDTLAVDVENLVPGMYELIIPADGQQILGTNGGPLAQYTLKFNYVPDTNIIMLNNAGECVDLETPPDAVTQPVVPILGTIHIPVFVHLANPAKCLNKVHMSITWNPNYLECFSDKNDAFTPGSPPFDNPNVKLISCFTGPNLELVVSQDAQEGTCTSGDYFVGYINMQVKDVTIAKQTGTDICFADPTKLFTEKKGNFVEIEPVHEVGTCYGHQYSGCAWLPK